MTKIIIITDDTIPPEIIAANFPNPLLLTLEANSESGWFWFEILVEKLYVVKGRSTLQLEIIEAIQNHLAHEGCCKTDKFWLADQEVLLGLAHQIIEAHERVTKR